MTRIHDQPQGFRHEFIAKVRSSLTRNGYQPEDFEITQEPRAGDVALEIVYRFAPEYRVSAWLQTEDSDEYPVGTIGMMSVPGEILRREFDSFKLRSDFLKALSVWVERMHAEMRAIPINRRVEEQQRLIDELVASVAEQSEEFFTRTEASDLTARLEVIEAQMADNLRAQATNEEKAEKRVVQLHQEIELLKHQLHALTRKSWARSMAIRVATWVKDPDNQKLLKTGAEVAKTLMLPSGSPPGAV